MAETVKQVEQRVQMKAEIIALSGEVSGLRDDVSDLKKDVKNLLDAWNTANGLVKFIKILGIVAVAVTAIFEAIRAYKM